MEQLEVFEEGRARWRWRFTDGNGSTVASNDSYDDPLAAMLAARSAYPDLEVVDERDDPIAAAAVRDPKDIAVIVVAILVGAGIIWWRRRNEVEDAS